MRSLCKKLNLSLCIPLAHRELYNIIIIYFILNTFLYITSINRARCVLGTPQYFDPILDSFKSLHNASCLFVCYELASLDRTSAKCGSTTHDNQVFQPLLADDTCRSSVYNWCAASYHRYSAQNCRITSREIRDYGSNQVFLDLGFPARSFGSFVGPK